jgi:catechol 2,3-dioxygenase-like lactoylglutathione lyase family enzyme
MTGIHVQAFDHLVLRCADVERTLAWYLDELGLAPVRVDAWRAGEVPFPSVRVDDGTIIDLIGGGGASRHDGRNVDHLCLVVDAGSIEAALAPGRFTVVDGPDQRFGARGMATSVYVLDPDGNVVELRDYSPTGEPGPP